jgi:DNA topoisomerase-1
MLSYIDDSGPGITRKRRGRYWMYFDAEGSRITDREEIDRLNAIGMPPAYERCWFCPKPEGHLQAIGYDAKGRKQYRYHPDFRAEQEAAKYERLASSALPAQAQEEG